MLEIARLGLRRFPCSQPDKSRSALLSEKSDPTTLRWPASVVRHGRHVGDAADLEAERVQRAHCRLAARAGTLDAHLEVLHAIFLGGATRGLSGDLRSKRRRFARTLEAR